MPSDVRAELTMLALRTYDYALCASVYSNASFYAYSFSEFFFFSVIFNAAPIFDIS